MAQDTERAVREELERQAEALVKHRVPELVGLPDERFARAVDALRPAVAAAVAGGTGHPVAAPTRSRAPFVLVVSAGSAADGAATGGAAADMAAAEQQVPLLRLAGGSAPGVLDRNHGEEGLAPYRPIEGAAPPAEVYALVDVDRGEEFRGVPPQDALPVLRARGRSPLTVGEGIALVLLYPSVLEKNACFMLSGSRRGDRRVPALWISGKAPKLGWCWDGNPHTWLGVASTGARVAG